MTLKHRTGGVVLWTLFVVVMVIFTSGAVAVYTVFLKPENQSTVPLFRDRPVNEVLAEIEALGLVPQVEYAASSLPEGRVLAQSPEAGSHIRKGQPVVLQVAHNGQLHELPDVTGKSLAQAQSELKSEGFALGDVIRVKEPKAQAGSVLAQSPSASSKVSSGRKIDLLVQEGTSAADVVTIPDVNRMTEQEARSVIEATGLKVQAVDRVYSPLLPEGLAIETRPGAGNTIRTGQGLILKLATQKRPAGFMESDTSSTTTRNGSAVRVSSQNTQTAPAKTPAQTPAQAIADATKQTPAITPAPAQKEEAFIGDNYEGSPTRSRTASTPSTPAPAPASTGSKTARIRYTVPPIIRPMTLRIEITDPAGKRTVLNRQVRSGENINTTAKYSQECVISYYLDNEFLGQEKQS